MQSLELAKKLIFESKKILICLPYHSDLDEVCSALSIESLLSTIKPTSVDIVSPSIINYEKIFKHISDAEKIKPSLPPLKSTVIQAHLGNVELKEFTYDIKEGNVLEIKLDPKSGAFENIKIEQSLSEYKYDLIITISASDLNSLGNIFKQAPDFFYNTTKINIDNRIQNTNYGQINIIQPFNISISEIIYDLIKTINPEFMQKNIQTASYILTGIMSKNRGIQNPNTPAQTLQKISELISYGVNITKINKLLYYNKSVNTLKLWGRILARLQENKNIKLIYSYATHDDFIKTNTKPEDIPDIINEFISTHNNSDIFMVMWQGMDGKTQGAIKTTSHYNISHIIEEYNPQGNSEYVFFATEDTDILESISKVVSLIEDKISNPS